MKFAEKGVYATRATDIFTRAVTASREEHARLVRQFVAGKLAVCPCGMDMEREAIIKAFDEALAEPLA
jgi:hypothetical protein